MYASLNSFSFANNCLFFFQQWHGFGLVTTKAFRKSDSNSLSWDPQSITRYEVHVRTRLSGCGRGLSLLTLGTCSRGTVIILCVCVYVCVCYHASCYIPG